MGRGYHAKARRVLGGSGQKDDYINDGVGMKLPPPPELTDKDRRIKMLLEDVERGNDRIHALETANEALHKRVYDLQKRMAEVMRAPRLMLKTVRQIREERGMSCKELADRCGVTLDSMSKREGGRIRWRRCYVDKVCQALKIKESDAYWGEIVER